MNKYLITTFFILCSILCVNAFAQTNTYHFDVQKSGNGKQAMIFISGFACSADVWKETIATYNNEYTCYALTMAGFAGTQPKSNASFNNWATSIANFIKDAHIEKPILVGHSMGGALALAIAADHPDLISKIIVVDALPCLAALMNPSFKAKETNDCSAVVDQLTKMTNEQYYHLQKMSIPQLIADTTAHEDVISWSVQSDRKTVAEMFCDFSNTDLREKIKKIKCPSLILLESYFVHLKTNIEEQYKYLNTAHIHYANKGLHFIMYDDKNWYFKQINNFLATQ